MTLPTDSVSATRTDLRGPALTAAAGLGAFALLHLRDPHAQGSYGFCPYLKFFGVPCPGCGGLRAVNDLSHGDFVGAISSNAFAVALVATLAVAWVVWVVRRVKDGYPGPMISMSTRTGLIVIGVIVVFGIVRNLPFGAWLAP